MIHGAGDGPGRRQVVRHRLHRALALLGDMLDGGGEEVLAGTEVVLGGAPGDTGPLGDHRDRAAAPAAFRQAGDGGLQQLEAGGAAAFLLGLLGAVGRGQRAHTGARRSRKAVMPSRASAEPKSRADCSASALGVPVEGTQHLGGDQLLGLGQALRGALAQSVEDGGEPGVDVVGGQRDQPDPGRLGRVELLAGQVVAAGRAGVEPRQQRQRDDGGGEAEAGLGEGERGVRSGRGDVAGAEQPESPGPYVAGDAGDDRFGQFHDRAQQPGEAEGAGRGVVGGGGLGEVGARAEGGAGVAQEDRPGGGRGGRLRQRGVQFGDQPGGERVAVVRGVQGEGGDAVVVRDAHQRLPPVVPGLVPVPVVVRRVGHQAVELLSPARGAPHVPAGRGARHAVRERTRTAPLPLRAT